MASEIVKATMAATVAGCAPDRCTWFVAVAPAAAMAAAEPCCAPFGTVALERRRHDLNAEVLGPGVEAEPPTLGDQRAARLRLDMDARTRNERTDRRILVVGLDAQVSFRLVERQRLDRRRGEKK